MIKNNISPIFSFIKFYIPIFILFFSVLNEFDLNYFISTKFSFNFVFILIFYWYLKKPNQLPSGLIFVAGLLNDVLNNSPIGLSSLNYLLICVTTSYIRHITLRPNFQKDWIVFLITILLINSIDYFILFFIFSINLNIFNYIFNLLFTFIFFPIFYGLFDNLLKFTGRRND